MGTHQFLEYLEDEATADTEEQLKEVVKPSATKLTEQTPKATQKSNWESKALNAGTDLHDKKLWG